MLERCGQNPILSTDDVAPSHPELQVVGVFNPGAVQVEGRFVLLLRVAERCVPREGLVRVPTMGATSSGPALNILEFDANDPALALVDTRGVRYAGRHYLSSISHLRVARSHDGVTFDVAEQPLIAPSEAYEEFGVEDPRITAIDGRYYINYTAVSRDSWVTALASTSDFESVERHGIIFHPENKDVALFPERIGGRYFAIHRPNNGGFGKAGIWLAESPDLLHWGKHQCIARARDTPWERGKIGGGAPPIRCDQGWLSIYHGKGDGDVYSLLAMMHAADDPARIVAYSEKPLLLPQEPYETEGFVKNVVFSNGVIEKEGVLHVYYGAADDSVCVATLPIRDVLASMRPVRTP